MKVYKIRRKIITIFNILRNRDFYFYKGFTKRDLLIYDDIYPHPISGFRYEELTVLLSDFKKSKIIISSKSYPLLNTPISDNIRHIETITTENRNLKRKIFFKKGFININAKLFYCIFINNIYDNINWLEKHKIPFVFTLYPGGGFELNNAESDAKLKKVLKSNLFRNVIVTQKITKDYLLKNDFCSEDKIVFLFGGVVPQSTLMKNLSKKNYYSQGKKTLDICFCAAKYMPKGIDKGYDVFIDISHSLVAKYDFIKFHIVGGFAQDDIDVSIIKNNIVFYGYKNFDELEKIFQKTDIIISPNKPFVLGNGAFDGFPLGTVVEAALNGVLIILSDELRQNATFVNNEQLIIVESDCKSIEKVLVDLIENPEKIIKIATNGKNKFQEIYSNEIQMKPRIEILKKNL